MSMYVWMVVVLQKAFRVCALESPLQNCSMLVLVVARAFGRLTGLVNKFADFGQLAWSIRLLAFLFPCTLMVAEPPPQPTKHTSHAGWQGTPLMSGRGLIGPYAQMLLRMQQLAACRGWGCDCSTIGSYSQRAPASCRAG